MTRTTPPDAAPADSVGADASATRDHYLKEELYNLVRSDPAIFEFLQAGSLDGLWYWDLTQPEVEWMSPRFWEVLGVDPESMEHLAAEWQDLIFEEDLQTALENFEKHCEDPNHPYDQMVRYRHQDGSTVWVRCRGVAIRDKNGTPVRLLGAHTEVTALKTAQAELQRHAKALEEKAAELERVNTDLVLARRRLEEELASKDQLVAAVSHELRNPLAALLGFAEVLREDGIELDEADRDKMIETISRQGQDVLYLVEDLLAAARADAGELSVTTVSVNLRAQVAQVLEGWDPDVVGNVMLLGESVRAMGDPARVRQILRNLISNALRYGGGRVEVAVCSAGGDAEVTVSDAGPQIPAESVDLIFRPYQRALGTLPASASVGLGLSVSRQLAELMHGTLEYRYEGGRSGFCLMLPGHAGDDHLS